MIKLESSKMAEIVSLLRQRFYGSLEDLSSGYKELLVYCLQQVAFLGIDLQLQIDSLREDFVNSASFKEYVENVFVECDVDRNDGLDGGEFYAAVLLLYHEVRLSLDKIENPLIV